MIYLVKQIAKKFLKNHDINEMDKHFISACI